MERRPFSKEASIVEDKRGEREEQRTERIRIKNRRKLYLDRHPSYFLSPDLELADPLLYDRCVRRFQTAAEREADGRVKGYSGVLEADLYRSEAKLAALVGSYGQGNPANPGVRTTYQSKYVRGANGEVLPEDPDDIPKNKEEGMKRWKAEMTMRFLSGDDPDFSYKEVDESDAWDIIEIKEAEDRWFDDEEPEWVRGNGNGNGDGNGDTGIQDF